VAGGRQSSRRQHPNLNTRTRHPMAETRHLKTRPRHLPPEAATCHLK